MNNLRSNSWGIRKISGMCSCLTSGRFNMVDSQNRPFVNLATEISHIKFDNRPIKKLSVFMSYCTVSKPISEDQDIYFYVTFETWDRLLAQ